MPRFLQTAIATGGGLVALAWLLSSCASMGPRLEEAGPLTAREGELIEQSLVRPLPADPAYVQARQTCFFFVRHPEDQSMVPVGLLVVNTYVVLRKRDGRWVDIQLTSGQIGSMMSENVRNLAGDEGPPKDYLERQREPELAPLPQVSAHQAVDIDSALLDDPRDRDAEG